MSVCGFFLFFFVRLSSKDVRKQQMNSKGDGSCVKIHYSYTRKLTGSGNGGDNSVIVLVAKGALITAA